ncbi:MAG: (2Fe-2S) ferredoxin domain-containing protein [Acidobacteria bacterium]|nr:(2Fe-2S) ferredoxin domain-containing protein [Acidobacteriota bacterium]
MNLEDGTRTLILVCQNVDCKSKGAGELMRRLEEAFKNRPEVEVRSYMCFGTCQQAPNVVLYPQRHWYSEVKLSDLSDIIEGIQQGKPVERICNKVDSGARELIYALLDAGIY